MTVNPFVVPDGVDLARSVVRDALARIGIVQHTYVANGVLTHSFVGLRIDRILHSAGFPGSPARYEVWQPPRELSDHAFVAGAYRLEPTGSPGAR